MSGVSTRSSAMVAKIAEAASWTERSGSVEAGSQGLDGRGSDRHVTLQSPPLAQNGPVSKKGHQGSYRTRILEGAEQTGSFFADSPILVLECCESVPSPHQPCRYLLV